MFAPPYPSDAYLLRSEKRYRWRDAAGRVDFAALALVAKLLPASDLAQVHKQRLGRVVDRVQKAAMAYTNLAAVGMLDERFGFPVIVEVPDGGTRRGVSESGEEWQSTFMGATYGFLPDTVSRDAEEIDFIGGPDTSAPNVFIVGFVKPVPDGMTSDGSVLDEYKLFAGFSDYESAEACARANWPPERIGTIQTMPMEVLRGLLNFELEEGMVQKAMNVALHDGFVVSSPSGVVVGRVQKARLQPNLIEVECRGDAADSLRQLLVGLRYYGAIGASGPIYFESDGLRQLSGWDGDGDSKIAAIRVNGEKIYDLWQEPLPSALARPVPDELMAKYRASKAEMDGMRAGIAQENLARILAEGLVLKDLAQFHKSRVQVQKGAITTATFVSGGLRLPSQGSPRIMRGKIHDELTAKTNRCAKALDSSTAYQGHTRALSEFPDLSSHPALTSRLTWEYDDPTDVGGWRGAIEPDDESWICFIDVNGRALLWLQREDDGGIIGEPVEFVRPDLVASYGDVVNALWSTAYENTLPDSAFLYIEPGGEKDAEGKTVPRTLRHFAYRDDTGAIDLPHLRNAIARAPQANLPQDVIARVQEEGRKLLEAENAKTEKVVEKIAVRMCPVAKGLDASTPIDRRIVYGVVLEPEPFGGRGDGHDETYDPSVIRRAAYNWLASFGNLNDSHGRFLSKQEIVPVESFIAPVEFTIGGTVVPQGAWVVAAKICGDALWARVLSGDLNAWSIEGYATRECTTCDTRMKAKTMRDGSKQWLCPNCDRLSLALP